MAARGEWVALGALLAPWGVLSVLLPLPHAIAGLSMLAALAALLACAVTWSRMRAEELGLDAERWGVAAVLTLGFSQTLLLGTRRSGFEVFCGDCGRLQDARAAFCYACGSYEGGAPAFTSS